MNKSLLQAVRRILRGDSEALKLFDHSIAAADEAILIGSSVGELRGPGSDVDVAFVGRGRRWKSQVADFIWIQPKSLEMKSWLGSELASHIAQYGQWLKGDGIWRKQAFVSRRAISNKCERVLVRLAKIYNKRADLSEEMRVLFICQTVVDMQRAVILERKDAVPPTPIVLREILSDPAALPRNVCTDSLLGELGRFYFDRFIPYKRVIEKLVVDLEMRR